jgi:hypothetical protein
VNERQKVVLKQIQEIFSNRISLGISFRTDQEITKEFLVETPDIDFDSLDQIIKLCKKNTFFHEQILAYLVHYTPNP